MKKCAQCGVENVEASKFCSGCGSPLPAEAPTTVAATPAPRFCHSCGQSVTPGSSFCQHCGQPVAPPPPAVTTPSVTTPAAPTVTAPTVVEPIVTTPVAPAPVAPTVVELVAPTPVAPTVTAPVAPTVTAPVAPTVTAPKAAPVVAAPKAAPAVWPWLAGAGALLLGGGLLATRSGSPGSSPGAAPTALAAGSNSASSSNSVAGSASESALSTPEAAVRTFVSAINEGDYRKMAGCVQGADAGSISEQEAAELTRDWKQQGFSMTIQEIHAQTKAEDSTVQVKLKPDAASVRSGEDPSAMSEQVNLHHSGAVWKVVSSTNGASSSALNAFILMSSNLPALVKGRAGDQRLSCQSHLKQIGLALMQYNQDYDEVMPPASIGQPSTLATLPFGWADSLMPYLKYTDAYQCPSEGNAPNKQPKPDPSRPGYTDYYFNRAMAGQPLSAFGSMAFTIAGGDGLSSDARYSRTEPESGGTPPADTRAPPTMCSPMATSRPSSPKPSAQPPRP